MGVHVMQRIESSFAILMGTLTAIALVACSPTEPTEERGPQAITGWSNGGDVLHLVIGTCHGDPEAVVVEDIETVTVTVTSTLSSPADGCEDELKVELISDLGDRRVIDGVTDQKPPGIEG